MTKYVAVVNGSGVISEINAYLDSYVLAPNEVLWIDHDAMCPYDPNETCCDCGFPACDCAECQCHLIAQVREEERARAVDIVDHFFMDREAEQRIKSAIGDGAICTCPSESCPIAFGD
jgi:hypothetical protein